MINIKTLVFLIVVYCFICPLKAQISTPDTMVHKLFATLKAKDEKAFVKLYPNAKQMQTLVRTVMDASMKTEEMQAMQKIQGVNLDSLINAQVASLNKPEVVAQIEASFAKSFNEMVANGEQKGITWSNTVLTGYTFDTSLKANNKEDGMLSLLGYKNMKGVIDFTSGDSAYQLSFDKVIFIPGDGGWFGGEFGQIIRKGESFSKNEFADEAMLTDTALVVTPPKAKKGTKSSRGKTKTKAKVTAHKPSAKS